ncbi:ArsR/SmtB family transcription factor, partial [Streptomyces diastaticus]
MTWDKPHRYAMAARATGVITGADRRPAPEPLRALLGAAGAEMLLLLGSPRSATHLVAPTGQGLGPVGRHLKVLHEAGLIRRRRTGRSVLHHRPAACASPAEAAGGAQEPSGDAAGPWPA